MLSAGRLLDRSNDLPVDAKLCKRPEGCLPGRVKPFDRLEYPDHAFLNDIVPVSSRNEVKMGFGLHHFFILSDEILLGLFVSLPGKNRQLLFYEFFFLTTVVQTRFPFFLCRLTS